MPQELTRPVNNVTPNQPDFYIFLQLIYKARMKEKDMEDRLNSQFHSANVVVLDTTGGGSNFDVRIICKELSQLSRVKQHQSVMSVFKSELQSGEIHALAIKVLDPDQIK